jgi:hypothetical protein
MNYTDLFYTVVGIGLLGFVGTVLVASWKDNRTAHRRNRLAAQRYPGRPRNIKRGVRRMTGVGLGLAVMLAWLQPASLTVLALVVGAPLYFAACWAVRGFSGAPDLCPICEEPKDGPPGWGDPFQLMRCLNHIKIGGDAQ